MEDDQELKHMCKFCYKSFPCGRSLGGHMRSHLINIPFDHNQKTDKKLLQKKLPPPINPKIDDFVQDGGKFGSEKPKEKSKLCKECGKSFQSWKALFGHMKCHSVNGKAAGRVEDDSWNSSNESDDESATLLCRKKRSEKMKRYTSTTDSCSFNMIPDFSPCDSEIDQHEEEEVALSLILLSRDSIGNSRSADSAIDSSDNSSEFLQANKNSLSNNNNSKSKLEKLIKKRGMDQFEADLKKEKSNKRKLIDSHDSTTFSIQKSPSETDFDSTGKFTCTVCKKAFASYQALGGHRASHKKFNGCCAPVTENSHENVKSTNPKLIKKPMSSENLIIAFAAKAEAKLGLKKNKDHECPICFKVFQSGQALGGHKRSHVVANQAKLTNHPNAVIQKPEARDFLDLNLPAPDEVGEQSNVFKLWWIGPEPKPEPLLGLLSS